MRKSHLLPVAAAISIAVAGTVVAYADPPDATSPPSDVSARADSVTLPTGDVVTVGSAGNLNVKPAAGRADVGVVTVPALDGSGDVSVIPADRIAELAERQEDPRRYNVSELLRNGQTDAASADVSAAGKRRYGQFAPIAAKTPEADAAKQSVEVTFTDHAGKAAKDVVATYLTTETGTTGELTMGDDGVASVELPAGEYDILSSLFGTGQDSVDAITPVTVGDEPVKATMDGTRATELDATVKSRDTEARYEIVEINSQAAGNGHAHSIATRVADDATGYAMPVDANGKSTRRLSYHATLSPTNDPNAYYNLIFGETDGIPADLSYSVAEDELAAVDTKYHRLAGEQPSYASACGLHEWQSLVMCLFTDLEASGKRQQYYTAGEELYWADTAEFVKDGESQLTVDRTTPSYKAGRQDDSLGAGPFGPHLGGGSVQRMKDTLFAGASHLENPGAETVLPFGAKGSVTLSKDGEQLDQIKQPYGELELPKDDSGRYTLALDATLASPVTPLGSKASARWEFASEPSAEPAPVELSSVIFDAAGLVDGAAAVDKAQEFTLDYRAQAGATGSKLDKLGFEVSYDDGQTWQKVDVAVDGNTGSGTLKHPADAAFLSYRVTASDVDGNSYDATSTRSYALS